MSNTRRIVKSGILLGIIAMASACVVAEPHEGYYDHDHHRYWVEHSWHDCGDHDEHCR